MTALHRKLWRDLLHLRTQAVAIALVIACGVATLVMSVGALRALDRARDRYYDQYRFAHLFARLKRAPEHLAGRIAGFPGVLHVQTRIIEEVTLDLPGMIEPAIGRLISLPEHGPPLVNRLHLRLGRLPERGRFTEVLLNEPFAEAHALQPGDTLHAILNGRRETLHVVGIALSPEYIYQVRPGDVFPDNRRFGVLWISQPQLAATFDLDGAFNDVALTLSPGAEEQEVIRRLDDLLAPYGGHGAHGRSRQVSHQLVSDELTQLRAMASIPPALFLAVSAFILHMVLHRLVTVQREQVAALKAFGYTRGEVAAHYLALAALIIAAGTLLGIAAGLWLGHNLTTLYTRFFRFPFMEFHLEWIGPVLAATVAAVAGTLGVLGAVRRAARLPPAEAMRPEPPPNYRPTRLERAGWQSRFSQTTRMIVRQLERRPARALLSLLGMALAVAILILGSFSRDILDYVSEIQFRLAQRHDLTVDLVEPTSDRVVAEFRHLPGVLQAEPFRTTPVRLRHGPHSRQTALLGLPGNRDLFQLIDLDLRNASLPAEGVVLSRKLAELLDLRRGDRVRVEILEGARPVRDVAVTDILNDLTGLSAYMELTALRRLLREGPAVSGVFLRCDSRQLAALHAELKQSPRVTGVASPRAALASFQQTVSENLLRMRLFNVLFAAIIAFGVVYNSARVALSERARELATLRVIGFTRTEISAILLGEMVLLTLAALPPGLAAGYGLSTLATAALETETQRFPCIIQPATYAFAILVVVLASLASSLLVRLRIDHLDLIAVLKARD